MEVMRSQDTGDEDDEDDDDGDHTILFTTRFKHSGEFNILFFAFFYFKPGYLK